MRGSGSQIYTCQADSDGKYNWTLKGPDAELKDRKDKVIGQHSAGPTWKLKDGSEVIGKEIGHIDSLNSDSIPWLLLDVINNSGKGALAKVTKIQRVHTRGGQPGNNAWLESLNHSTSGPEPLAERRKHTDAWRAKDSAEAKKLYPVNIEETTTAGVRTDIIIPLSMYDADEENGVTCICLGKRRRAATIARKLRHRGNADRCCTDADEKGKAHDCSERDSCPHRQQRSGDNPRPVISVGN